MTDLIATLAPAAQVALRELAARNGLSVDAEARFLLEQAITAARRRDISNKLAKRRAVLEQQDDGGPADGVDRFLASKRIEVLAEEDLIELSERLAWEDLIDSGRVTLEEVQAAFDDVWPWSDRRSS
jgi:plasmid stability protein